VAFNTSPLVSVLVGPGKPCAALDLTLRSVRAQSLPSVETFVCEDGDEANVWNAGLAKCGGEFVCCLVAGDQLAPTYLEKCLFQMTIDGSSAAFAVEEPANDLPRILVTRREAVTAELPFVRVPAAQQRAELAVRLAKSRRNVSMVPELLAFPGESSGQGSPAMDFPTLGSSSSRPFTFAPLIRGWAEPRPTILLTAPFLTISGADTVLSQSCRQLKRLGFRVLVCTTVPPREDQGDATDWYEDSALGIYHLPCFLEIEHWPAFIAYLIQQHGVNILWQVGSTYTYDLLPRLRELFPHLAIVDLLFNREGHGTNHLRYNYLIDHSITEHAGIRNWLLERGESEDRISVIPNGVDLDFFSPQPKQDWRTGQLRSQEGGRFVVGFIGRLSEEKGPDLFLKIASALADERTFEFIVCGSGPMDRMLRSQAVAAGLSGSVSFLGVVPARECLSFCDVVVVCSRLDGRPNIILESLATGTPVIASRVGGIPEMLPPGDEDLLCEPDPEAFAAAILKLTRDPDRYRRSSEAARCHSEKSRSYTDNARIYARLFEDLSRKRQRLNRHLSPEAVAANLGYDRSTTSSGIFAPLWRSKMPFWRGFLSNALLFWKVRRSGLAKKLRDKFDADYYRRQSGNRWLLHYIFLGFREGRNPSAGFDTRYYLTAHPDVRRSGVNPLLHFVMWGEQEGRMTAQTRGTSRFSSRVSAFGSRARTFLP